jgi:hypothetical protein
MRYPYPPITKKQPDPWPTQYTLTNLPTCTNKAKLTQPRICPIILNPCTSTTQTLSSNMVPKVPAVHGTRSRTGSLKKRKNTAAADDLQKLVDREKRRCERTRRRSGQRRRKPKKRRRRSRIRRRQRPALSRSLHPVLTTPP